VRPPPAPADLATQGLDAVAEHGARILFLDDQPGRLRALEALLAPLGQRLVRVGSDEEALHLLATGDVALVLVGAGAPAMDGFEAARRIEAAARARDVPIAFLAPFDGDPTPAASLASTTARLATLNAELQRRQAELRHALAARNRFYASVSHELRTPINAILGYGELLLDDVYGPLNERQRQGLERSHKAAAHLLDLVNDVLDLSRIEAGKVELALQPVTFPAIVDDLLATVRPAADEHGVTLAITSECERTIVSDPRRVRQIVLNLLSNAIKFGAGHAVEVRCGAVGDGGVEVTVVDHGPGIPAADLARVFEDFVQLPNTGEPAQGTGLGLSVSRRLARLLGGDLTAESVEGAGSTFRLRLPADGRPDGGA
jgi:signal transduction histidine kinase